jgi:hypothetical protein
MAVGDSNRGDGVLASAVPKPRTSFWLLVLLAVLVVSLIPWASPALAEGATGTAAAPAPSGEPHPPQSGASLVQSLPACQWGTSVRGALELPPIRTVERAAELRCGVAVAAAEARAASDSAWAAYSYGLPLGFPLYGFVMASDSEDHAVLLFGGVPDGTATGSSVTWEFKNGNWTQLQPLHSPVSCLASAMTDDPKDGYVVYLGGLNMTSGGGACPSSGQTWVFKSGDWTRLAPLVSPPAVGSAAFANDSADGYLVLFGGENSTCRGGVCNETWTFSAGMWTELRPSVAPSNRSGSGLTFDASDQYMLLFGGGEYNQSDLRFPTSWINDTWSFQNGSWKNLNIAHSPPEPFIDGLTFDAAAGAALYTNADDSNSSFLAEELWSYQGGNWTELRGGYSNLPNATNPPQRVAEGAAYDWSTGAFVLYGGDTATFGSLNDTWTYAAGNWSQVGRAALPLGRQGAGFAYDAADGYDVLFGGYTNAGSTGRTLNDTWRFDSGQWTHVATNASPPASYLSQLVYDASDGYLLLFGGYGSTNRPMNDTWEYTNGGWTEITPATSPESTAYGSSFLTYDAADGYVLLLENGYFQTYTWSYHAGSWTNLSGPTFREPDGMAANPLVYDSEDGYVLLTGVEKRCNGNGACLVSETWRFRGGGWSNLTAEVGSPLPAISQAVLADDPADGYVLLYGGVQPNGGSTSGYGNGTWQYVNGNWTRAFSPQAVPVRQLESMVYDPALKGDLLFGGYSYAPNVPGCAYASYCNDLWQWSAAGLEGPAVASFAASPPITDVNRSTTLRAVIVGGTTPYNYTYASLPPGCVSANTSTLACTPIGPGTFNVLLTVSDSRGNATEARATLTVEPALSIISFVALPPTVAVGNRTLLSVTPASGVEPVSYTYTNLPVGCITQRVPTLPCTPTSAGNVTVTVVASDAVGAQASAALNLSVIPVGSWAGFRIVQDSVDPSALVLGNETVISLGTAGNLSAPTYAFEGLPPGCAGTETNPLTPSLACYPTASGVYPLTLVASATGQGTLSLRANLTVYPVGGGGGLSITAFSPLPGTVRLGNSTVLGVSTEGGIGALTIVYRGLPPGCASSNSSSLTCTPSSAGVYPLEVVVSDSGGDRVGALGRLTVAGTPPGHVHSEPSLAGSGTPWWQSAVPLGLIGFALGAVVVWSCVSAHAARRRAREEGESIVRALNDETK